MSFTATSLDVKLNKLRSCLLRDCLLYRANADLPQISYGSMWGFYIPATHGNSDKPDKKLNSQPISDNITYAEVTLL